MQCQNPPFFFFFLNVRVSHHGRNGVMEVRRSIGFHRLGITQKFVFKGIGRFHGSATADWIPPFGDNAKIRIQGSKPGSWKCDGRLHSAVWG